MFQHASTIKSPLSIFILGENYVKYKAIAYITDVPTNSFMLYMKFHVNNLEAGYLSSNICSSRKTIGFTKYQAVSRRCCLISKVLLCHCSPHFLISSHLFSNSPTPFNFVPWCFGLIWQCSLKDDRCLGLSIFLFLTPFMWAETDFKMLEIISSLLFTS